MAEYPKSSDLHPNKENLAPITTVKTTSDIKADPILGYKLKVLLFDIRSIANPDSERRILATTNELYISSPYFTCEEAACVRKATVHNDESDESQDIQTVEDAIHSKLNNFFEKRKGSRDMRPCGPHDLAPVYQAIFGISSEELADEKFLSRLRRQGLPALTS
ncbi:putative C6 transcription factor [Hypoxylon sp. NC1633]|nr:putative C6 transcription factor [Hypoxylon sp. NC1633]